MKGGDFRPRLMKTNFPSSYLEALTLEAFRANRQWLPSGIHMHSDKPHDARIKHKGKLELTITLVGCQDKENKLRKNRGYQLGKLCVGRLPVHTHKAHTDKNLGEALAFQIESMNCLHMSATRLSNKKDELRELSNAKTLI